MKRRSVIRRRLMQRRTYQENRKRRTGPNSTWAHIVELEAEKTRGFFATLSALFSGGRARPQQLAP